MWYNIQIEMCGMEEETGQTASERMADAGYSVQDPRRSSYQPA
jgi:hypothetical protein